MTKTVGCGAACVAGAMFVLGCGSSSLPTEPTSQRTPSAPTSGLVFGAPATGPNVGVSIPASFTVRQSAGAAIQACVGENVAFSADALIVGRATTLPNGSVSLTLLHFSGRGAAARAQSSGTTYYLNGADASAVLQATAPMSATIEADLQAVGPDSARAFTAHAVERITMERDGSTAAVIDLATAACSVGNR